VVNKYYSRVYLFTTKNINQLTNKNMRKINKLSTVILSIALILGSVGPMAALAATTPSMGAAASYAILAGTYTNTSAGTTVTGDIGFTTGPFTTPLGVHTNYGSGAPTPTARIDAASALSTGLATQVCTFTFAGGSIDLATDTTHGPIGVYTPGVYCNAGAMVIGTGGITLNGAGTYIFRTDGEFSTVDSSVVTLSGSSACDVFWTPTAATTLGANTQFEGTIIDNANAITVGANTNWTGRALSLGAGTVTTGDTSSITVPTCVAAEPQLIVNKIVINDNGGTKVIADFPLFIDGFSVTSGVASTTTAGVHTVSETADSGYTTTIGGNCASNGTINLVLGDVKTCTITNNDIAPASGGGGGIYFPPTPPVPPLIDVVKVPNPLALPAGPGSVKYTYTLRNIGTVPVTDITMVGDTCSPIIRISGDTNVDNKLDVTETWVHTCSTILSETHTNIVTATGWSNGISASDIANATVIVGIPVVPPLIHVTKVPSPLVLIAGGGMVTYTNKVTNPGTVPLSNVRLTDDKCGPVKYISGDTNNNLKLDTVETWTYTCETELTQTTVNTITASGEANGLTARDFAIATVVVSPIIPGLPNTGIPSYQSSLIIIFAMIALASISLIIVLRKRTN
jgi:hypothetical protein